MWQWLAAGIGALLFLTRKSAVQENISQADLLNIRATTILPSWIRDLVTPVDKVTAVPLMNRDELNSLAGWAHDGTKHQYINPRPESVQEGAGWLGNVEALYATDVRDEARESILGRDPSKWGPPVKVYSSDWFRTGGGSPYYVAWGVSESLYPYGSVLSSLAGGDIPDEFQEALDAVILAGSTWGNDAPESVDVSYWPVVRARWAPADIEENYWPVMVHSPERNRFYPLSIGQAVVLGMLEEE